MNSSKLSDLFDFLPKSKIKAGDGLDVGQYPFYTSSENQTKYLDQYLYEPGCLVFGTGGKANSHYATRPFATSTDCIAIKPKADVEIHPGYVFQYFKGNMQVLENGFKGAGLKHISKAYLSDILIPYPDEFDDQIRIAHLLGKVEGLIAQRKQHLRQLDDLLKSVFLEMFGDPVRNEKGWAVRELGTAFKIKHGFAFTSEFFSDSGPYVLLTPGNFFEEGGFRDRGNKQKYYVGETPQEYILNKGDLLLAMTEQAPGLLGSPLIVPEANLYLHNQRLGLVVGKEPIQSRFLFHLFNQKPIRQIIHSKATGTKVRHTSPTKIESIVVGYPPIDLQNQFAAIVEKVDGIKSLYQQSLAELETLYAALSQQAFKGELDLSRVPMPSIELEDEKAVVTEPLQARAEESLAINLPDTDNLLDALENTEAREALIALWLEAYRGQLGGTPFSVQHFMAAAQTRLAELHPDNDFELGVNDYEHIKAWVFEALADGRLQQSRNITGHDECGEPIFGNFIEIKSGARP